LQNLIRKSNKPAAAFVVDKRLAYINKHNLSAASFDMMSTMRNSTQDMTNGVKKDLIFKNSSKQLESIEILEESSVYNSNGFTSPGAVLEQNGSNSTGPVTRDNKKVKFE
jgi:hypothetical protein